MYFSREEAANKLWVSTRTIDRYIRKWKLSYKKVANKVMILQEDVFALMEDFWQIQKTNVWEIVSSKETKNNSTDLIVSAKLDQIIDSKFDKFFEILEKKDKTIQEKDALIFALQKRIWELESKMSAMIALPDYSKEKQILLLEKQKLQDTLKVLKKQIKDEKIKTTIWIWILLIFIVLLVMSIFMQ